MWILVVDPQHTPSELRKIFGLKREEIRGDWRKLHCEEFYDFHFLPDVFRMRWLENVVFMGEQIRIQTFGVKT